MGAYALKRLDSDLLFLVVDTHFFGFRGGAPDQATELPTVDRQ